MDVVILSLLGLQLSKHGKHDYCNITLMYIVFRARVDDGVFHHPKPGHRLSHLSFKNTKTSPLPSPPPWLGGWRSLVSIWEKAVIETVSIIKTFHGYVLRTFKYDTYFTSQMNLFKNLWTNYGQGTIKIVRKAENTTRQIARHRNHLVFNLRCKGECVIPPSLRLKCPINSDKVRNIVEKARKNLLRERIRPTNQKISHLQDKKRCLAERFPSDVQQQLNARLTRVHESVRKQAKCRQQDKLASLISKSVKNKPLEPDLSGTQIKRWVVNLSKYNSNRIKLDLFCRKV